jgi:N-succinyldiaminopimelate aminotransferase
MQYSKAPFSLRGAAGVWSKVNALAAREGKLNMGQGFPDFAGSEIARAAAQRAIDEAPTNQYSPQAGQQGLRNEISSFYRRRYGVVLDPGADLVVTSSGQEALSATFLAMLDPGDEVVIFEPFYPFLLGAIELAGGVPRFVRLSPPEFAISVDAVNAVVNERTRMIVHNRQVIVQS